MANAIYPKWKQELMGSGQFANPSSPVLYNVRAVLVDTSVYTYNPAHSRRSDLTGVVGDPSAPLTGKTFVDGVFDADNTSFIGVTGNSAEAIVIFIDQGTPSSDRLMAYLDSGFTGLPVTPDGNDIPIVWGPDGIFKL